MKVAKSKKTMISQSVVKKDCRAIKLNKENTKKGGLSIDDINRNFFGKLIINNSGIKKGKDTRVLLYTDY